MDEGCSLRVLTQTAQAPHNAVKAEELSVFVGSRCLLENTELKISEQTRALAPGTKAGTAYGLVGQNGCGKSTLLRLIAEGQVPVPEVWDVFLVSQHLPKAESHSVLEEVLAAHAVRARLLQQQAALEEEMAATAEGDAQLFAEAEARLRQLCTELASFDDAQQEVREILLALGFRSQPALLGNSPPSLASPMKQLSGGWRMKVELAKALWLKPRLLLLDEPSNHLDFQALQWLQEQIEEYPHTAVVVSHDVSLLHGACQEILWIRDRKLESMPRDVVSQEDLVRMQRSRPLKFEFLVPEGEDPLSHGLSLHGVEFSYPREDKEPALSFRVKGDVRLSGKSRAVLLGKNGSGKSTFLDLCVGKLAPCRGSVDRTPDLQIGHYSQLTDELDRCSQLSAADFLVQQCQEALAARLGSTRGSRLRVALGKEEAGQKSKASRADNKRLLEVARGVLSHFGLEGDVGVKVPVDRLSGGQKACLKFAVLSLRPAHILLLDEPTNHLDAEACKALAEGLANFKGGIVAVTHDELLIYRLIHCNWTASELLLCQDGCLRRERNFSAQCLKSIKEDVRRAEELEKTMPRPPESRPSPAKDLPAGEGKAQSLGPCPPWLLGRARRERPAEAVKAEQKDLVSLPGQVASAEIEVSAPQPSAWARREISNKAPAMPAVLQERPAPNMQTVDSWEELDEPSEASCEAPPARHSRFRKDLVNLNKAATKWIQQEERGDMLRKEICEKIVNSTAAETLRALHGERWDERRFLEDVLTKAIKASKR